MLLQTMMCCAAAYMKCCEGQLLCMSAALLLQRRGATKRRRRDWKQFIRPILRDGSFRRRYRMSYRDFRDLYGMLRSRLEKDVGQGRGRNGIVTGEWALAGTLRWLAGGTIQEVMDGPRMARSTAYACIQSTLDAIVDCKRLRVRFPRTEEELDKAAAGFRGRSSQDVINNCVSAAGGLLVRRRKPTSREHVAPERFCSGHGNAVGKNMQVLWTKWLSVMSMSQLGSIYLRNKTQDADFVYATGVVLVHHR